MKKIGFTLAEILITMGVIGVVAALAAPAVVSASSKAKLGPTLSKAVSSFEAAAELLLTDEDTDSLVSVVNQGTHSGRNLGEALSRYMKLDNLVGQSSLHYNYKAYDKSTLPGTHSAVTFASSFPASFITDNNILYYITDLNLRTPHGAKYPNITTNQRIGEVYVDINGAHGPNTVAKDLFKFYLYNDGTLRPFGTISNYDRTYLTSSNWQTLGFHCNESHGVSYPGWTCTGSIFDNNMKAIYK